MQTPPASNMILHAALARSLAELGVDTMFGLIGNANLFMVDRFVRDFGGRYVAAAHEAGAVLMALGYAQVTGSVGVATVTHGPGLTNALSSLIEGVKGTIPLVLIAGDTAIVDRDNAQNVPQRDFIMATGAGFEEVRTAATMVEDTAAAFRRAILERRPIVLNVPINLTWEEVEYNRPQVVVANDRSLVPASDDLDNAAGIIAWAKRPIVLAGRGATDPDSRSALIRLAQRIGAPLATTLKARGLFDGENFNLGVMGTLSTDVAAEIIMEADCIIAFGAGLNKYTLAHGSFLRGKRLIQVDVERAEVGRKQKPDAGLVGDPGLTADRMVELLDLAEIPSSDFIGDAMKGRIAGWKIAPELSRTRSPGTVDVRSALSAIDAAMPVDRVVIQDASRCSIEAWKVVRAPNPRSYVHTENSGAIGQGMGAAIGAAIGAPNRPALLVSGDGGFMLGGWTEFATAVHEKVDLTIVICNDGGYGYEYIQFHNKQMDPSLSLFNWPDFAPVAVAMGGDGITVRSSADLESAVEAIRRRNKPLLIDLKLDPVSLLAVTA